MTNRARLLTEEGSPSRAIRDPENPPASARIDRGLPFLLRVAVVWTSMADLPKEGDGLMRCWRRAPLTGSLALTSDGHDVSFSDLEVR